MIRIEEPSGWILIRHPDHARLAGAMASHWGNAEFPPPEPRADVLTAVSRHDDAWAERDAMPRLTREGRPSAFSRELVGAYSAFEEIDLADYLAVRGRAAALIAADNPFAALVVSLHTVDLLGTRADPATLQPEERALIERFVEAQRTWQAGLAVKVAPEIRQRAFEFLQACDSLSLAACVRFPRSIELRHTHPDRRGERHRLVCTAKGDDTYEVSPYPFDRDDLVFKLPCRRVAGNRFVSAEALAAAWNAAPPDMLRIRLVRPGRS